MQTIEQMLESRVRQEWLTGWLDGVRYGLQLGERELLL